MTVPVRISFTLLLLSLAACSQSANPTRPSPLALPQSAPSSIARTLDWSTFTAVRTTTSGSASAAEQSQVPSGWPAVEVTGQPRNLTATVTGRTVTLTWLPPISPEQPTSYVIEAGSSPGASNLAAFDTGSTALSLTVAELPPGTYYVRVLAKNSRGASAPSNEAAVIVTPATCIPGRPSAHTPVVDRSSVILTWTVVADGCQPTHFLLAVSSTPGGNAFGEFSTGTATTTFVANGVGAGTYYIRVRAANAAGVGAPSNEVVAIVGNISVTGRWLGVSPHGMIADPDQTGCPIEWDLELNLQQNGTTVTGTATTRNRKVQFAGCSDVFGVIAEYGVSGTVNENGAISLRHAQGTLNLTGTVSGIGSGATMSGRYDGQLQSRGRFTVIRQ